MQPRKKERRRSTHLELLGGVPSPALRRIREIAAKADLPLTRVFQDVVAIGVSIITDPAESPYQSLIAFRAGLSEKQAEFEFAQQRDTESRHGPVFGGGNAEPPGGVVFDVAGEDFATRESEEEAGIGDRLDDAFERPGQPAATEENTGLAPPD